MFNLGLDVEGLVEEEEEAAHIAKNLDFSFIHSSVVGNRVALSPSYTRTVKV